MSNPAMVSFVGAGPGDPGLLTIKGREAIAEAGLVLYAGSLVPRKIIEYANKQARVEDSSPLTLEQTHALVRAAALDGLPVARVHTGDPSLYGALAEQAALLDMDHIPWQIIPGITAACAAAAAARTSLTMPELTQSVVITRLEGRTPMPARESIASFARHKCSMAIYLSAKQVEEVQTQLADCLAGETPVIIAHRIGWPDEKIIRCTVETMARMTKENGLERQTVFLALPGLGQPPTPSRLYAADFEHSYRHTED